MKDSYLELENNVTHTAGGQIRKRDGDHKGLINLGSNALRSEYTLTNSSASEKEKNYIAHNIFLMYKLILTSTGSDNLSIGFHRSITNCEQELTDNKTTKGKYQVRLDLKAVFGLAEHQQNATHK